MSPFHFELLKFLKQDVEMRASTEGFDLKADVQLQKLLEGLSPTKGPLPLGQIIESYQHIFGARGPLHVEKLLLESIPPKEFMDLNLSRYYPRMYRGLPRLYHKTHPSQSHIKRNFIHLPSLKKQAVTRALYSLYQKAEVSGTVTLFTWVIGDGLGDYIAAVEVLRLLKGRFPNLDLRFICLVPESLKPTHLPDGSLIIPYTDPSFSIPREALIALRESDLILQMPTFYPHTEEMMRAMSQISSDLPMPKMESVGEYGFLESSWFHPKSGNVSMGLHFLEKGILIRKPCLASWNDVQNEHLRAWREPKNHFYLAYLTSPVGGAIYLHALLKSLESDSRSIDICVPDLNWFIQFIEKQEKEERSLLEWDLGVSAIVVHFENQVHTIPIAPSGKTVRLLSPGRISQSDFRALLALSGEWVAVRGDQSFSEAVSQGKAFFYDGREHARYFFKDLIALAENRIGSYPPTLHCIRGMQQGFLYNLSNQEGEWVDETYFQELEDWQSIALQIGLSLQAPETITGYKKLNQILTEEFSVNAFLCHLVQRALTHRKDSELEQFEAQELESFATNQQSFSQMIRNIHGLIQSNGRGSQGLLSTSL